jgi:hypothetical protein
MEFQAETQVRALCWALCYVQSTRTSVKDRKRWEEERQWHECFKEMWKNGKRKEEEDENAKGMTDIPPGRRHVKNDSMKEIIPHGISTGLFEQQLRCWQSLMSSLLNVCYNSYMVSSVASRSSLTTACIHHVYCITCVNKAKTRVSWSRIGHWYNPWCENNIIIVIQLLLTYPRMLIYIPWIWVTHCNIAITTFRLLWTAVINKIYPCATYGPELRMQCIDKRKCNIWISVVG